MATLFKLKPENIATPLLAETVSVPPKVLLPGLAAKATVSLPVKPVATFPSASSAVTVNPNPLPAVTVAGGGVVIKSCVAAPGATEIELLVPEIVAVGSVAVIVCVPALSIVATIVAFPPVNETTGLLVKLAPPTASLSVTESLKLVTTSLKASSAVIVTASVPPAVKLDVEVEITSLVAC